MQHSTEATKQYQCRHIFTDRRRCASPCLRQQEFCHHTTRRCCRCSCRHPERSEGPRSTPRTHNDRIFRPRPFIVSLTLQQLALRQGRGSRPPYEDPRHPCKSVLRLPGSNTKLTANSNHACQNRSYSPSRTAGATAPRPKATPSQIAPGKYLRE
jgi:hypothetical protein